MRSIMITVVVMLFAGCSANIHIPAAPGEIEFNKVYTSGVCKVVSEALSYTVAKYKPDGEYMIYLPGRTIDKTYAKVMEELPRAVTQPSEAGVVLPTYQVAQIYVSGLDAQVDVIIPMPNSQGQLISVYLKRDFLSWYVNRDYVWRISLEDALNQSRGGIEEGNDVAGE